MNALKIFDRAMCCSTGVCGTQVDPALAQFAADLDWLRAQGVEVERFNLAQQPGAFVTEPAVKDRLVQSGPDCLPAVLVAGRVVSEGVYPTRGQLAVWSGAEARDVLPLAKASGCCSPGSGCC